MLASVLPLLACACSPDAPDAPATPATAPVAAARQADSPAPASVPRAQRGAIDAAGVGSIRGTVRFEGQAPERKPMQIGGVAGCPRHDTPPLTEDVVVSDGRLANVLVHVKEGQQGWDVPPPPSAAARLDQQGCLYRPHALALRAGQRLEVHHLDPAIAHNVNIRSDRNEALNPTQAPGGPPVEWTPQKREIGVRFECNLHNWMRAFVHVLDHPWFAVTGPDGTFAIEGLPPGEYVLEAWHEKLERRTVRAVVRASSASEVEITFRAP